MTWSIEEWNEKAFMRWAGLRVLSAEAGVAVLELAVQDHHRGGGGTRAVNGAILAYMHDVVQGVAISSLVGPEVLRMATLNLAVDYPRLLVCEERALVEARVLRLGATIAFCDSEFRDAGGNVCSRCHGTYQVKRTRPSAELGIPPADAFAPASRLSPPTSED
ncbi:MAG: hypothetical protein JWP52_3751 [Rhizobacter sp.]|jgi:acyl-coenzyme A thioesterase PaaI-like protein|nr:hypothetical protein [Rhizobacter sp.]